MKNTIKKIKKIEVNEYNKNESRTSFFQGVIYGLIPHTICIAFIVFSVLGVTVATAFFKQLLLNSYFFYGLIALSLAFATISSAIYLKINNFFSSAGIKRKWKYLSLMYGSTIGVNFLFFLLIFPIIANVSASAGTDTGASNSETNNANALTYLSSLKLKVDIPCSGHAPLIIQELKTINGVSSVEFSSLNIFDVKYNPQKTSEQKILALDVFKTYKATVIN